MKLPYVRFSTSMSIVETNLQATFGAGLMSTYRSGITSTDRQLTASSTTKRKTPVSVPTSSETQRQIEQPSDASDIDLPEVAGPQKHLIGKISRSFEEIQKTKSPLVVRLALSPDHKYLLVTSTNQNGCFTLVLLPGPYKPCIHRKFRSLPATSVSSRMRRLVSLTQIFWLTNPICMSCAEFFLHYSIAQRGRARV